MQLVIKDQYGTISYGPDVTVAPTIGSSIVINGTINKIVQVIFDYTGQRIMIATVPEYHIHSMF